MKKTSEMQRKSASSEAPAMHFRRLKFHVCDTSSRVSEAHNS